MKKIVYSTVFLFAISFSIAYAETFSRTLTLGSRGQDVLILQKILNSDPSTSIASTGIGSSGFETTYFGEKTKQAVIKLQNLHADKILTPVGLTEGTGIVGQSTRDFLNTFEYTTPTEDDLTLIGTSTPTFEDIHKLGLIATSTYDKYNLNKLLKDYNNASTTQKQSIYFTGTSTALTFNNILQLGLSTSTPREMDDIENLINTNTSGVNTGTTTAKIYTRFASIVTASHPAKKIYNYGRTSSWYWADKEFLVTSDLKISNPKVHFFLGETKMRKNCSHWNAKEEKSYLSEYACNLFIDKDTSPGTYTLSTNIPALGTQKFKVVSTNIPYPTVTTSTFKLGESNRITGTGFTPKMKVTTIFGTFDVETQGNSFNLVIPNNFNFSSSIFKEILEDNKTMQGAIYVENDAGLQSPVKNISYEK